MIPNPNMTGVLLRRGEERRERKTIWRHRDTHKEDGHVKMEAETGVMVPQVKEHLEL
jgi:hypothetical protein